MTELALALRVSVVVFAVASMLSVGLAYSLRQILGPLRDVLAVVRAVVVNFLFVPLLAFVFAYLLPLDPGTELGLALVGAAAGAPFLVKLTAAARGDVGLSATLLVLLMPLTILYLPIIVPVQVAATEVGSEAHAQVSAIGIATPLVSTMLVPLALGLIGRAAFPRWAWRLRPILSKTASVALVALIALTLAVHFEAILAIGIAAFVAAFLLVGGAFAIGYLVGGPGQDRRTVLGLGTGQRNISAATVVATQSFPAEVNTLIMVVVTAVVGLLVLFVFARRLRALSGPAPSVAVPG